MACSKNKQDPSTGAVTSPKAGPHVLRHGTQAPSPGPSSWKASHRCCARRPGPVQQLLCAPCRRALLFPAACQESPRPGLTWGLGNRVGCSGPGGGLHWQPSAAGVSASRRGWGPGRRRLHQSLTDKGSSTGRPYRGRTFQGVRLANAKVGMNIGCSRHRKVTQVSGVWWHERERGRMGAGEGSCEVGYGAWNSVRVDTSSCSPRGPGSSLGHTQDTAAGVRPHILEPTRALLSC